MFKVSKKQLKQILTSAINKEDKNSMDELKSTKQFIESLKSNIEQGLTDNEIRVRQQIFGINEKETFIPLNLISKIWSMVITPKTIFFQSMSVITLILTYISTEGIFTNEWIERVIIFVIISLNPIILSAIQLKINDNNKKNSYIQDEQQKQVVVLRNGKEQTIIARDLVVGDIVILKQNDKVYVDGLIVEQSQLQIYEGFLTGEILAVPKITIEEANQENKTTHFVYAESDVLKGNGKLLVLAVGENVHGYILQSLLGKFEEGEPIIDKTIENISSKMEIIGFLGSLILIIMVLIRYIVQYQNSILNGYSTLSNILNFIIVLLSWNSSKALINHYKIQLAQTLKKMLNSKNLVRMFQTLENLSFMDKLIIDAQSLYENYMVIVSFLNDTDGELTQSRLDQFPQEFKQAFIDCCFLNYESEQDKIQSKTEEAFYLLSQELQIKIEERKSKVTHLIPYTRTRRSRGCIVENNRICMKGASDIILKSSNSFYSLKDGIIPINDFVKNQIEQNLNQLSQNAGVITAIAYRDIDLKNENIEEQIQNNNFKYDTENLTLLGFFVISSKLKDEGKMVVEEIQQAGVKVILVGGDNQRLIKKIAQKTGIMSKDSIITEGNNFTEQLNNKTENFQKELEDICAISRATPEIKQQIVQELQQLGHIVGVTGHTLSDVNILKQADVSYCMGRSEQELVKENSGILLLDNSLHYIYLGIILARNLLDSIKRLIQYQITTHISLIIILIVSLTINDTVIITPLQFVWIKLITDLIASLSLSYCKPSAKYQKPFNKKGYLIDISIFIHIIILSVYTIAVCILFVDQTLMVFNIFVITTLFNLINSNMVQLEINIFQVFCSTWMIYISILIIGMLQYFIVEQGGKLIQACNGLSLQQWLICILIGFGSIVWRAVLIMITKPILAIFVNQKREKAKLKVN
ncbi:unnamed protein product [Paramecium sonneborni]|uniref:Cation-transporting P-type ATPase N-terminal domain-containing protein n=1 Tax=Paramecium sonneborni TaxID=65129 RepID=A0A8S1RFM5_9CILI|nr:unnamed protein product [Paramecium sonneborni]